MIGKENKPRAAEALTDTHLEQMYQAHTVGDASARALIHSMWYTCTTFFGMRTGAEIRNMRCVDVNLALDPGTGREFLELKTERQTKSRTGKYARNVRQNQPRAYATEGEPSRDPVHLFKVYSDRRRVESPDTESPFLLSICTGQQKGLFRNCAIGINSIYSIKNTMKADASIEDQRITPYSARKRLVQKLNDKGVPPNQIVQISGHKNLNSLNNYSRLNTNQAMAISDILSSNESSNVCAPSLQKTSGPSLTFPPAFFVNPTFNKYETNSVSQQQNTLHSLNSPPAKYRRIQMIPESESNSDSISTTKTLKINSR